MTRGGWLLVLVLAVFSSVQVSAEPDAAAILAVIYSGNLDGELEPCGCTLEGDFGGILRRATMLDRLRQEQRDAVFLSAGGLLMSGFTSDVLKSEYILRGIAALGYDAVGIQWNDLSFGPEFLAEHDLPWVASNWHDNRFPEARLIHRGNHTLAVFSWLDPEASPYRHMRGSHRVADEDPRVLIKAVTAAKNSGHTTVLMTTRTLEDIEQQFPLQHVDVLFVKAAYEVYGEPRRHGGTLVLQPGSRGMRLGRLDLALAADGAVASWRHDVIELGVSIPDAPRLAKWYDEYNARVETAYLESVERRKAEETGRESPYAGEQVCQSCHREAHETWSSSRHSGAYRKLEDVNKAFDPGCIVCHSVGFDKAGGFIDIDSTGHLANVQCESCHGAGRAHAASGGQKAVAHADWSPEKMCAQCHNASHSPTFKLKSYWSKIAH